MSKSRKERVGDIRSQEEREDDAFDLHEKGYPYEAIGDLQGVSGPTAKSMVQSARIRALENEKNNKALTLLPKKKVAEG